MFNRVAINRFATAVWQFFGSRTFFRLIIAVFIFQALWIALSARYPMAFDENYHVGLIQEHTKVWTPYLTFQPDVDGAYGAAIRDPSYLYHYLMSWPYRLVAAVTSSQAVQVVSLRLLNIGMFVWALYLFRMLARRLGATHALANISLALFTLIPIVPFLAAHVNYDNLFIVLTAATLLLALRWDRSLAAKRFELPLFLVITSLCMLNCLVKYPSLPISAAIIAWMGVRVWQHHRTGIRLVPAVKRGLRHVSKRVWWLTILLTLVSTALFMERYAYNAVVYKAPVPDCAQVVSVQECIGYGPWGRDYYLEKNKDPNFVANPVSFTQSWVYGLWFRCFFMVRHDYATSPPLPIPSHTAIVLAAASGVALVVFTSRVFKGQPGRLLVLGATGLYAISLWVQNYELFLQTSKPVAINGRYLLVLLPPVLVLCGMALSQLLGKRQQLKTFVTCLVLLLFLQGGGFLTFILRSDASWDFQSQQVISVNNTVRSMLKPIIIEGK